MIPLYVSGGKDTVPEGVTVEGLDRPNIRGQTE